MEQVYFTMPYFGADIAKICYEFYSKLAKTGKPKEHEWTVLSCIVKSVYTDLEVVALGTGSKCIGKKKMSADGDILNDSHAEVMARRGFIRYIYEQIELCLNSEKSIFFLNDGGTFSLLADVYFHFFSTQSPCGDASIIVGNAQSTEDNAEESSKNLVRNTGAKCINKSLDLSRDAVEPILGQVRTKPGKGDPTLSVSCSDKLARWIRVGFQGALLDLLLNEPLTVQTIVIGGDDLICTDSIKRALFDRTMNEADANNDDTKTDPIVTPLIISCDELFEYRRAPGKEPSYTSMVWSNVKEKDLEVAVGGKRQGITKKNSSKVSSSLLIAKKCLFSKHISLLKEICDKTSKEGILQIELNTENLTYKLLKAKSVRYGLKWASVKKYFFGTWTEKPDLLNFPIDE